ncbi:MAG: type transport system permease protein [Actinomycetota bacterium]|nr:type transport system permease protein [Actinomycetota bacterium]
MVQRVRELYGYREILLNLVRKELKVKYTASVLGAVWSLLNPIVFLIVFTFVVIVTGNNIPRFPVFLLSGLLAWNMFSVSLAQGARAVLDNANLVKKVYFPRELLPMAAIGVSLVDFVLQSAVLLLFMIVSRYPLQFGGLVLYPLAFLTLLVFTTAATFWVSALNVRYRDVQHLVNLGLLVWFWFTPIVYSAYLVRNYFVVKHPHPAVWYGYLMNPLASIVMSFQRALYGVRPITENNVTHTVLPDVSRLWLLELLGITLVVSLILLRATWGQFFRLSGDFAEEL